MEGSDQKFVTLKNLDLRSTGLYKCEVSAERPSFASVSGYGRMTVIRKSFYNIKSYVLLINKCYFKYKSSSFAFILVELLNGKGNCELEKLL